MSIYGSNACQQADTDLTDYSKTTYVDIQDCLRELKPMTH